VGRKQEDEFSFPLPPADCLLTPASYLVLTFIMVAERKGGPRGGRGDNSRTLGVISVFAFVPQSAIGLGILGAWSIVAVPKRPLRALNRAGFVFRARGRKGTGKETRRISPSCGLFLILGRLLAD
jgi:hypothetical protein